MTVLQGPWAARVEKVTPPPPHPNGRGIMIPVHTQKLYGSEINPLEQAKIQEILHHVTDEALAAYHMILKTSRNFYDDVEEPPKLSLSDLDKELSETLGAIKRPLKMICERKFEISNAPPTFQIAASEFNVKLPDLCESLKKILHHVAEYDFLTKSPYGFGEKSKDFTLAGLHRALTHLHELLKTLEPIPLSEPAIATSPER